MNKELKKEEMENLKICECCGKEYNYRDEPAEVKEGGIYICPECWAEEEKI